MNQNTQPSIDVRYRTMLILWFAMFMSIGIYFAIVVFMAPPDSNATESPRNMPFTIVFTAVGALFVLLSFVVNRKLLKRSVELQKVALVQQALIVACVMCEVSAILGMVHGFLFATRDYYLLFLISAIGFALNFPRREQLMSASYRTSRNGAAS